MLLQLNRPQRTGHQCTHRNESARSVNFNHHSQNTTPLNPTAVDLESIPYYQIPGLENMSIDQNQPLILLVEDHNDNVVTMGSYLIFHGYRLIVAQEGLAALALAKDYQPDLIVMDVQIPNLNGLAVTQALRSISTFATTPIIAVTALAFACDRDSCLAAGATEYLAKPIRLKTLLMMIQKHLSSSQDS